MPRDTCIRKGVLISGRHGSPAWVFGFWFQIWGSLIRAGLCPSHERHADHHTASRRFSLRAMTMSGRAFVFESRFSLLSLAEQRLDVDLEQPWM